MTRILPLLAFILISINAFSQGLNPNQCGATGPFTINPNTCGTASETPLINGNGEVIGKVEVVKNGNFLTVTYRVTSSNWVLTETHLHVSPTETGIPINGNNDPAFSSFTYKGKHDLETLVTYSNIDVTGWSEAYIASRAVALSYSATKVNMSAFKAALPSGNVLMRPNLRRTPAYFDILIGNSVYFTGVFFGNCVDLDNPIRSGGRYNVRMVSSYDSDSALLACIVDKPQNLDLVNYIINTDFSSIGATGTEIQAAIWTLVDDDIPVNGYGSITWDQAVVDSVIADAMLNGEGFFPSCDQNVAVLLDQGCYLNVTNPNITVQQSIAYLPILNASGACEPDITGGDCRTFWGAGKDFEGTGCATYFRYCF